jgi:hypothetical protein
LRYKHKLLFQAAIRHGRLFLVYIVQLILHLKNWATGLIGLVLLLAEVFPTFASIFPDGRGDRIMLAVGAGLLVSAYRIFEDDHAQIEALEGTTGPEPRAGEPALEVRHANRVIATVSPVPRPDLAEIGRDARRTAIEEFDREAERLRPKSFIDFAFQEETLRDREAYERDVARYAEAMQRHAESLYQYLNAVHGHGLLRPAIVNTGTIPASNVTLEIELPPAWRAASGQERSWILGGEGPAMPSLPKAIAEAVTSGSGNGSLAEEASEVAQGRGPLVIQRDGRQILKYPVGALPAGATVDDLEPAYLIHEPERGAANPFVSRVFATELTSPLVFELTSDVVVGEPLAHPYSVPGRPVDAG